MFTLVHGLDELSRDQRIGRRGERTWTDFAHGRWDALTPEQAQAIVHYLEWRVARGGPEREHMAIEALAIYWYGRAADGAAEGR